MNKSDDVLNIKKLLWDCNYIYLDKSERGTIVDYSVLKKTTTKVYNDIKKYFNLDLKVFNELGFDNIDERKDNIIEAIHILGKVDELKDWKNVR